MTATPAPAPTPATLPDVERRLSGWSVTALLLAGLIAAPVLVVAAALLQPFDQVWGHLWRTTLPGMLANTALLLAGTAAGTIIGGTAAAWLVTMCRFPGSRVLEWALVLPFAMPTYLVAYVYAQLFSFTGPVQTLLRGLTGWRKADYWFPEIYSVEGAILVMVATLYPYVYLTARAAFLSQSVCVLEVGRTLGCGPWAGFLRVALPLARPGIAIGASLAMMEALADFGAVHHLGVDTFTTSIYRTWFGMADRVTAAQLSSMLLGLVLVLILAERASRGAARYHHTSARYRRLAPLRLSGWRAAAAFTACILPVLFGFALPAGALLAWHIGTGDPFFGPRFIGYAYNSLVLAGLAALVTTALAVLLAYAQRLDQRRLTRAAVRLAGLGYALPGSVIAVGILVPLGALDNAVDGLARAHLGVSTGLLLSGTIAALLYAYAVRFLAVALGTVEAGLARITPSMDDAARTLGATPAATLSRVHLPVAWGSVVTAAVIVFVDVLKELPATLIVRPFDFDTLAVRVYTLASDERLAQASTGALMIVAVGLLPVMILSAMIARSRPGAA
ncbi:MAG: iron ABC transporter permease [Thalassobaculales bacterium]